MGKLKLNRHDGREGSKVRHTWSDEEKEAFASKKAKLCASQELCQPDVDVPYRVHCDASDFAVGADI
jgi:hypothetical protein